MATEPAGDSFQLLDYLQVSSPSAPSSARKAASTSRSSHADMRAAVTPIRVVRHAGGVASCTPPSGRAASSKRVGLRLPAEKPAKKEKESEKESERKAFARRAAGTPSAVLAARPQGKRVDTVANRADTPAAGNTVGRPNGDSGEMQQILRDDGHISWVPRRSRKAVSPPSWWSAELPDVPVTGRRHTPQGSVAMEALLHGQGAVGGGQGPLTEDQMVQELLNASQGATAAASPRKGCTPLAQSRNARSKLVVSMIEELLIAHSSFKQKATPKMQPPWTAAEAKQFLYAENEQIGKSAHNATLGYTGHRTTNDTETTTHPMEYLLKRADEEAAPATPDPLNRQLRFIPPEREEEEGKGDDSGLRLPEYRSAEEKKAAAAAKIRAEREARLEAKAAQAARTPGQAATHPPGKGTPSSREMARLSKLGDKLDEQKAKRSAESPGVRTPNQQRQAQHAMDYMRWSYRRQREEREAVQRCQAEQMRQRELAMAWQRVQAAKQQRDMSLGVVNMNR